ncbi:MAG: HDIG domain-containing protein [Ruminococcaceae bacterium]|nr:HDIG domain-containing protein [Oscillospiraceae bacterium]
MKKIIIIAISFIVTFLMMLTGLRPVQYNIEAGRTSPADIYAPREIVDKVTTEKRRTEAEADLQDKFEVSPDLTQEATDALKNALSFAEKQRELPPILQKTQYEDINMEAILRMSASDYTTLSAALQAIQATLLENGIADKTVALEEARLLLQEKTGYVDDGMYILEHTLRTNKIFSPEKTEEARQTIRQSVEDITYKPGQIIVRKGDVVTQAQYEVLSELGMVESGKTETNILGIIGTVFLLLTAYGVLYLYMRRYAHECLKNDGLLLMIAIIFALTMLLSSAGVAKSVSPYLLPIIAGTALIAILLDIRFAITYNAVISILSVLIFDGDVYCLACLVLSGTLSAFVFTRQGLRHTLVYSAVIQIVCQFCLYFAVGVLEGLEIRNALLRGLYGFGAGTISSVLIIGTLPFWEYAFDVTTPFKLLELANPDQPLLKRLLTEAPGTYHHSLMVGNLAEVACEAVGGNALLARTGAYYHDVGKLRRPQYFKENQYAENPHDKMSPQLSASIIISHVKDGTELARHHRLPGAIRNIIASHHGNSLVSFFYHKEQIENDGVAEEAKFRYTNPRPQTREEAIVMLADSVEAAVRSMEKKDEPAIRDMVQKILRGKLNEGLLGESGLTLRDIETVESAFVHVFCGYFHSRIQYPDGNTAKEN